jgi:hypothetical protein
VLEVDQVLHVFRHLSPPGVELQAGEVTSYLQALTLVRLLLIPNRKQHDRRVGRVGEVSLAHGGERHVCHLLDGVIQVASNDSSDPWCCGVNGYLHPNLTTT